MTPWTQEPTGWASSDGAMGRPMTEHLLRRPDTPVAIHGRGRERYAEGCPYEFRC